MMYEKVMKYYVVINVPEHSGYLVEMDPDEIWSGMNPGGWTYQDICGSHGNVMFQTFDEEEAKETLEKYLDCDKAKRGEYCYTHNPGC